LELNLHEYKDFQAWIAELEELMQQGSTLLNIKKAILDPENIPMNLRAHISSEIVPAKI
jgi:hypothetical protein